MQKKVFDPLIHSIWYFSLTKIKKLGGLVGLFDEDNFDFPHSFFNENLNELQRQMKQKPETGEILVLPLDILMEAMLGNDESSYNIELDAKGLSSCCYGKSNTSKKLSSETIFCESFAMVIRNVRADLLLNKPECLYSYAERLAHDTKFFNRKDHMMIAPLPVVEGATISRFVDHRAHSNFWLIRLYRYELVN